MQERRPRWGGIFGQLGPICCHFHGQTCELSGMKLSTDQVPPSPAPAPRQGSPHPGGEHAEGAGTGGVAGLHAQLLLGADGGRMEGGWASSSSRPLPTLLSPQTSRGSARPQHGAEPGLASLCPRTPGNQGGGLWPGRNPIQEAPQTFLLISASLCCHFCSVPRKSGDRESAPSSGWGRGEWDKASTGELRGT